ncbi:MAG: hypothetical protein E7C50_00480 [Clostridium sp.]|uniref:hypothetical protein n=1 Tax=Clostridium sp. TaxID=1506 RepID=UPI002902A2F4|nr:hypothetical protein [Clostridium sp.]MDU2674351.1 hypothetical protein [Clostridium sp.]MDU2680335.1 hypothetical protein [Clostridium sp.]
MKLKKISYMLSMALVLASIAQVKASAYDNIPSINSRAIITDSVVIDKEESNSTLLPGDVLEEVENRTGSITITLSDTEDNRDKSNVKFGLSKVADVINGEYKVLTQYEAVNIDLNNIKTATDLELAANLFKNVVSTDNILTTDKNGKCTIDDLDVGVYLLYATDISNYENITPFLVSIPSWNETDKSMSYDINVIPKHTKIIEEEKPKVPPTAYDNKAYIYLGIGTCLLLGSGVLFFRARKKERCEK